jgi:hypothetical protein
MMIHGRRPLTAQAGDTAGSQLRSAARIARVAGDLFSV